MAQILPFKAVRPNPKYAADVAALPYDVMTREEGIEATAGKPLSFLHVEKSEIDVPDGTKPDDDRIYETAKKNFAKMRETGVLIQDASPCYYIYRQRMGEHVQTGIVGVMSAAEYDEGKIKKHELTRKDKQQDRTRHVDTVEAQTGPVFVSYVRRERINARVEAIMAAQPDYDFTADDGIVHTAWVVSDAGHIDVLRQEFAQINALYIADGHHRAAAGSAVAGMRRKPGVTQESDSVLAVFFPHDQLKVMDYNRAVRDLHGLTKDQFLHRLQEKFIVVKGFPAKAPKCLHEFGMYLDGAWYGLTVKEGVYNPHDPVASLDAAILQDHLLAPILGIADPRTDERIKFIGGIRGMEELEKLVDRDGFAVAFSLYPTSMEQIIRVADAGAIMPPKSTWFEPKLRSGLFVHALK